MSSTNVLFYTVGFLVLIVALLFCHAFEIHNGYIYYPLALVLGYKFSMALITYFFPTAWEAPPPEAPKSRQGKKKFAKDADAQAKRAEMLARKQADADRKLAEARERD